MTSARRNVALEGASTRASAALLLVAVCCTSRPAAADPQWHLAVSPGACWVGGPGSSLDFSWCGSASGHVLFLRQRDSDLGVGPYARVLGILADSASPSGGISTLVPLSPTYPVIVSIGAVASTRGDGTNAGADVWLFWGPTSYNFHSSYGMASGLLFGMQKTWGSEATTTLALTGQLDLALAAIPFIALFELLRGPPER